MVDCLVITGATATGKSAVANEVARRIDGEIISLDSRQVYQGMDIGTAKATPQERALVAHHGLDLLPPSERYSAGRFAEDARGWIAEITGRGHIPILVGGTGFFLRALTHPLFAEPELDEERKDLLREFLNAMPREELVRWLERLDPVGIKRLHSEAGRQRIARMLEIVLLTGRPLHTWQSEHPVSMPAVQTLTIVLTLDRETLYERINTRVHQMLEAGLVSEVKRLLAKGYDEHTPGMKTVGYAELIPYLRGESTLEAATDAIQRATRQYARRQATWFRHQLAKPVILVDASAPLDDVVELIVTEWQQYNENRN
jgi:tRNA dimethylallyltransferase